MTAADFYDWKRHPMTQVVMSEFAAKVADIKEQLAETAGVDPARDRYYTGYIAAFNDILRMEYNEVNEQ